MKLGKLPHQQYGQITNLTAPADILSKAALIVCVGRGMYLGGLSKQQFGLAQPIALQ